MLTSLIITPLIPPAAPSSAETYTQDEDDRSVDGQPRSSVDSARSENGGGELDARPASTKWRRGESVPAVVAVTNLAVNGDGTPGREGLRVRAAGANLFTSYVAGSTETQLGVLSTMLAPPPDAEHTLSSGSVILHALRSFPSTASRNDVFDSYVPFFACLLFSHLIMHSEVCKEVARKIYFQGDETSPGGMGDEDDRITLVGVLVGNLMMAQREQAQSVNAGHGPERVLEWSRIMVGYLTALSVWMWESPGTVKEFLSEGSNLQVVSSLISFRLSCRRIACSTLARLARSSSSPSPNLPASTRSCKACAPTSSASATSTTANRARSRARLCTRSCNRASARISSSRGSCAFGKTRASATSGRTCSNSSTRTMRWPRISARRTACGSIFPLSSSSRPTTVSTGTCQPREMDPLTRQPPLFAVSVQRSILIDPHASSGNCACNICTCQPLLLPDLPPALQRNP